MATRRKEVGVPVSQISVQREADAGIAVVGNPNSGKSTLFNRLTGLSQRIGNYPGVTVERHVGMLKAGDRRIELIDLPGTHSLSAHSLEERIVVDVIFGRLPGSRKPDAVLAVVDATNLYQGLYLVQQLQGLDVPLAIALTMTDAAAAEGLEIDVGVLRARLGGIPVCPVVATTGEGLGKLRRVLQQLPGTASRPVEPAWPELAEAAGRLVQAADGPLALAAAERLLIDGADDDAITVRPAGRPSDSNADGDARLLNRLRREVFGSEPPLAMEARVRYRHVLAILNDVQRRVPAVTRWHRRITDWLNRPWPGTIGLFVVMAIVFQAVFAWATPLMDLIDAGTAMLAAAFTGLLGDGMLASLVSDGVIAGVGSVVIFLPQILILFLFIILLEDSGYLARAAYLMDRAMRSVGLSGQSIIPMISSFACAVPGIMATRVIPNRRDRIATILAAPFMTCSARLPVYALLIAAFVPAERFGILNLQGLVLFGLYLFGIVMGVLTALLLRKTALRGPKPPFALMLPEFRRPNLRTVAMQLWGRGKMFLYRAGTVIFAVAVVIWALAYFPRSDALAPYVEERRILAAGSLDGAALDEAYARIDNEAAALQLEQSWLGRAGKFVELVFTPLGWDWRVSAAVIAGFPAREVVVAVLGTVYAVGDQADEANLSDRLASAVWPDGRPVFTLPMVLGLLVFYACCLQCAATIAVIRRETNGWRWPAFAWFYMTAIGYAGALLVFRLGS